jgi:hypothetical protein
MVRKQIMAGWRDSEGSISGPIQGSLYNALTLSIDHIFKPIFPPLIEILQDVGSGEIKEKSIHKIVARQNLDTILEK